MSMVNQQLIKEVKVIKKNGDLQDFKIEKIIDAVGKSADRAMVTYTNNKKRRLANSVIEIINRICEDSEEEVVEIPIAKMHNIVEKAAEVMDPEVAKSYRDFRDYKTTFVEMINQVYAKSNEMMFLGDRENANSDSSMVSTQRALEEGYLSKELYRRFFLTAEERKASDEGYIKIHDMSARRNTSNCCLFDVGSVLDGGFEMGNIWYNEPKSLDVAFDVIGDIVLSAASQQYGGFTVPEVDKILAKYAQKTYDSTYTKAYGKYMKAGVIKEKAAELADVDAVEQVEIEMRQGYQGWEYKFNTVASSRGDYPFITITLGLATDKWGRMAAKTILKAHREGQGKKGQKKPVLFPKIVCFYTEELHGIGKINEDVFEEGILTSAKTMYPDWLSLDGPTHLAEAYHKYGKAISPMGCVDGKEIVTYKYQNRLYVESFERMWMRLSEYHAVKYQNYDGDVNVFLEPDNVQIYDTEKGFVNTKYVIRNLSKQWLDVKLSNGRRLLCTSDHPFEIINKGEVHAQDLHTGDSMLINSSQYTEENVVFNKDRAWLLGFMLCDGCYQKGNVFASIAANGEDDIAEKFTNVVNKIFGVEVKEVLQQRGIKGTYKDLITVSDNKNTLPKLTIYFTEKFGGVCKYERHIPNEVFEWDYLAKLAFLAGMIDADGYVNEKSSHGGAIIQIGSTNKELALQQMALAQALGMPAKIYHNHYNKKNKNAIRYRVEFFPSEDLVNCIACEKKKKHYTPAISEHYNTMATVISITPVEKVDYSYDVTTDSEHFEVSGIYSHNCRAFLSPWYERGGMEPADESDTPVFTGRSNIGVVTLHLPMILAKSRRDNVDFYEVLDYYLEIARKLHIRTMKYLGNMKASINPLGFCQGGFHGGNLNLDDKIAPVIKSWTASFGFTALNELQQLYDGRSLAKASREYLRRCEEMKVEEIEGDMFCLDVLRYLDQYLTRIKKEDDILYALYGTPAESLCGDQVKQFLKEFGPDDAVTAYSYVSNSFHCHVTEDITPIEKQNLERPFWKYPKGGRIQYVKYPIDYNIVAIKILVRRAMEFGYYEGVNLSLSYCNDCGHQELEMDTCPCCGSDDLTKIERMNGYLSYSRVHGKTRLNDAKMAEIADRKSM